MSTIQECELLRFHDVCFFHIHVLKNILNFLLKNRCQPEFDPQESNVNMNPKQRNQPDSNPNRQVKVRIQSYPNRMRNVKYADPAR